MPTTPADVAVASDTLCPKCEKPLIDPHGLGWCQACGYCGSLDSVCAPTATAKVQSTPTTSLPIITMASLVPGWAICLIAGIIVLALASWTINRFVTLTPLQRATWTTVQVLLGVIVMAVGQCYALIRIAPEDAALHAFDALVPFRLYGMVFARLPKLCSVLYFGGWGLTLVVSAVLCIGGLGHWLTYLPKSK